MLCDVDDCQFILFSMFNFKWEKQAHIQIFIAFTMIHNHRTETHTHWHLAKQNTRIVKWCCCVWHLCVYFNRLFMRFCHFSFALITFVKLVYCVCMAGYNIHEGNTLKISALSKCKTLKHLTKKKWKKYETGKIIKNWRAHDLIVERI